MLPRPITLEVAVQSYTHFNQSERESLSEKLKEGKRFRQIAREMNRDVSSISREYRRNCNKDGTYHPWRATVLYMWRRKRSVRKIRVANEQIKAFVVAGLKKFWSPEIISARWKIEHPGTPLAFSTLYRSIKRKLLPGICPKAHLRRRGKRKNSRGGSIVPVHTIHDRPAEANERQRLGDLEGDTVYGAVGKGCLLTLVDRTSRFFRAAKADSRDSAVIEAAFEHALNGYSPESITLDRGSEFAAFLRIEQKHNTTIYFADPHSPWQRGSNENINGLIRFFFPKGTDFHAVTNEKLDDVVSLINNRPRKCLGWLSPIEFLNAKCCT